MWWLLALPLAALGVVVVVLAIAAALIAAAGIAIPWLLFGVILWAVFAAHGGGRRRHRLPRYARPPQSASAQRVAGAAGVGPRPRALAQQDSDLPIDVQVKVDQIQRKVEVLLAYASRFPPFSTDLHIVRQTAADYLPRTIQAYLALPASSREDVRTATGKTARQELKDQLDLLDAKLNSIAEDLQRRDMDQLAANRRFLEERFGRSRA